MQITLNATEAREKFSEILNRVLYSGEEFIIQRQGKPIAFITKYEIKIMDKTEDKKKKNKWTDSMLALAKKAGKSGIGDLAKKHDKYLY